MHVICRATTDDNGPQRTTTDDVVRCRIEVDVRRRAVCERAYTYDKSVCLSVCLSHAGNAHMEGA